MKSTSLVCVRPLRSWQSLLATLCLATACLTIFGLTPIVNGQDGGAKTTTAFTDQQLEFFENKVRPLLDQHCFDCHGPEASPIEGGLSLSSRKAIMAGGDTGPAIVPGHAAKSLMIDAINYGEVYEMPPDTKMSVEDIATLTKWVEDGAAWPESTNHEVATKATFDLQARKAAHWCWQPIRKPAIPPVKQVDWPQDSIDNFILARLEQAELTPAGSAQRQTLIRRAYFDVIGLPPSPAQIQAFFDDPSADAFEKVVDELLASPRFGERWARHWMDLSRYAETGGHEFDYAIPYAYQYRDYLIRAFNEDVPYKQFVQEHIAGDLLGNPRRHTTEDFNESILGTGFWFLGEAKHGAVDSKGEEARTIDNQIDVMSKSFLGLTVACARCHDHKFDAISTEDYYALSGFLQSSRRQAAMLDPGRKIEAKFRETQKLVEQGGALAEKLTAGLVAANSNQETSANLSKQASKYINAVLEVLRVNPEWNQSPAVVLEGESLKQISVGSGETLEQKINKRDKLAWSGNKQYWWKHGKTGDVWVLEFEVPANASSKFNVAGVFTKASDYGAAKISLDDFEATERVDFYLQELKTARIDLGQHELKPGKHQLKIELAERNPDAAPSNMIGLDLLELMPVVKRNDAEVATIKSVAARDELEIERLENLITAMKHAINAEDSNPLKLLAQASKEAQAIDSVWAKQIGQRAKKQTENHEKFIDDSTQFFDFTGGIPEGWFRTGFAFGESKADSRLPFASAGPMLNRDGMVNSGQYSGKFFGVLRSPTFELGHSQIHYRYRGNNVTIRLIIDGFTMDEYNALLYQGCKFDVRETTDFAWQTQAGDLKNYLGHRAHIEIIDHGDGYIALDEIRFSNGAKPVDAPNTLAKEIEATGFATQEQFSNLVADAVRNQLSDASQPEFYRFANWIADAKLIDIFAPSGQSTKAQTSSNSTPTTDWQNVNVSRRVEPVTARVLVAELNDVRARIDKLAESIPHPQLAIAMTDGTGEEEHIFIRGNHKTLGEVATRHFLSALSDRPINPPDGSGRLQLAHKITAPNNPLTTRVAVNRIWHHLLGRGIGESVDNFGVLGKLPTHPMLLDYLATEFSANGQSTKQLIKRIMMTATYQMASTPNESAIKIDPDNNLLHRARIRRLQGEAIRDSMLQASGQLDLKMFGPSVPIHLTSFMTGRGRPGASGPLDGAGRRSVYIAVRRNFLSPMMLAFDTPIPFNAIGERNQSNVPAQALILMNDPFVIEQAKKWAEKLVAVEQSTSARITAVYETALGRKPNESELANASAFIKQQAAELGVKESEIQNDQGVWQDFCHVVFNLKEFIFIQ